MANITTPRKIALVAGPPWWGDDWTTRDGRHLLGKDRDARIHRLDEALAENHGLITELDRLTPGVALLLVGVSGATRLASTWANDHDRLTVRAAGGDRETAEAFAVELALAMTAANLMVRALVCVPDPGDPALVELRARGVDARPVLPLSPGDASEEPATARTV